MREVNLLAIRRGEWLAVGLSTAYFFCLLCAYFTLRPIRESMAVASGSVTVPVLFTGTFVVMALMVPVFGYLFSRFPKRVFLPASYGFFILNLLAFYWAFRSFSDTLWLGRAFFIWISVFNMFVVSVFWSFMTDLFKPGQARRLFGLIAAGGSAGAVAGPALTAALAPALGVANLFLVAIGFLSLALLCQILLLRRQEAESGSRAPAMGGSVWAGAQLVWKTPMLRLMVGVLVMLPVLNTVLYNQQIALVEQVYAGKDPTRFFALIDLGANVTAFTLELLLTSRLLRWLGVAKTIIIMPLLTSVGLVLLAIWPQVAVLGVFQALRRGGEYGLMKPARELLYTQVEPEVRYKAKNFIDTFIYRGGDLTSGWLYLGLSQGLGLGIAAIAWLAAPLGGLWAWLAYRLGLNFKEPEHDPEHNG
ncbi:MAG: MFS transporter [Pseudomonadota bacterium]